MSYMVYSNLESAFAMVKLIESLKQLMKFLGVTGNDKKLSKITILSIIMLPPFFEYPSIPKRIPEFPCNPKQISYTL